MVRIVYGFSVVVSKIFGSWFFNLMGRLIAAGFYVFAPKVRKISCEFYSCLYPAKSKMFYRKCAWKQFQSFTQVHLDRFLLQKSAKTEFTSEGLDVLRQTYNENKGVIMVMSHVGNWDVGAHLLGNEGFRILLYMGKKNKEQVEKQQKVDLTKSGVKIIAVEQDEESVFHLIEGVNFLKDGGLVSLTGDRIWKQDQRNLEVAMFGKKAKIPVVPFELAMLSGAPIIYFFVHRVKRNLFHFSATSPEYLNNERSQRKQAVAAAANSYAKHLEHFVKQHPFEWYHFEKFLY